MIFEPNWATTPSISPAQAANAKSASNSSASSRRSHPNPQTPRRRQPTNKSPPPSTWKWKRQPTDRDYFPKASPNSLHVSDGRPPAVYPPDEERARVDHDVCKSNPSSAGERRPSLRRPNPRDGVYRQRRRS